MQALQESNDHRDIRNKQRARTWFNLALKASLLASSTCKHMLFPSHKQFWCYALNPATTSATHLVEHGPERFAAGQQGYAVRVEGPALHQEADVRQRLAVDVLLTLRNEVAKSTENPQT
jgi:hypothetical protein